MSRKLDLSNKLRLSPDDVAYALSVSKEKVASLINSDILIARGGKLLKSDVENLLSLVYSSDFPKNIKSPSEQYVIVNAFCKGKEIIIHQILQGA